MILGELLTLAIVVALIAWHLAWPISEWIFRDSEEKEDHE